MWHEHNSSIINADLLEEREINIVSNTIILGLYCHPIKSLNETSLLRERNLLR